MSGLRGERGGDPRVLQALWRSICCFTFFVTSVGSSESSFLGCFSPFVIYTLWVSRLFII